LIKAESSSFDSSPERTILFHAIVGVFSIDSAISSKTLTCRAHDLTLSAR
jgi:hypothetical protein